MSAGNVLRYDKNFLKLLGNVEFYHLLLSIILHYITLLCILAPS